MIAYTKIKGLQEAKPYLRRAHMLTRIPYHALGMIEDLLVAINQENALVYSGGPIALGASSSGNRQTTLQRHARVREMKEVDSRQEESEESEEASDNEDATTEIPTGSRTQKTEDEPNVVQ